MLARAALDRLSREPRAAGLTPDGLLRALEGAHFPASEQEAEESRRVLAREELLVLAAAIEQKRARLRERSGIVLAADAVVREAARKALPFRLTGAQKRALREISADLSSGRAMARLLQGDVGSGKTVVAGLAFLLAAKTACRVRAHGSDGDPGRTARGEPRLVAGKAGVRPGLLTGRLRGRRAGAPRTALAAGELDLLVTRTPDRNPVKFRRLGLGVVDEQHRFGVAHRARLFRKGDSSRAHSAATPSAPLAWAIYGELDVSVLDEKPPGRSRRDPRARGGSAGAGVPFRGGAGEGGGARLCRGAGDHGRPARGGGDARDRAADRRRRSRRRDRNAARTHAAGGTDAGPRGFRGRPGRDPRRDDRRRSRRGRSPRYLHGRRERGSLRPRAAPPAPRARRPQLPPFLVRPDRGRTGGGGGPAAASPSSEAPPTGFSSRKRTSSPGGGRSARHQQSGAFPPCAWPTRSRTWDGSAKPGGRSSSASAAEKISSVTCLDTRRRIG